MTAAYYQPLLHCVTRPEGDGERERKTEVEMGEQKHNTMLRKINSLSAKITRSHLLLLKKENATC